MTDDAMTVKFDPTAPRPLEGDIRRIRFFLYGDEGIGKSSLALRLINRRGLWLTADSTWTVALTNEFDGRVDRIPWTKLSQLPAISKKLMNREYLYDLVILDPVTTALGDSLVKFVDLYKLGGQRAPNLPEYGHFYMVKREAETISNLMREVPCDVIYIAHTKDDDSKVRPNLNAEAAKAFYRECNIVGYMDRKEPNDPRTIQVAGTSRIKAKIQIPGIEEGVYSADKFAEILRTWRNAH